MGLNVPTREDDYYEYMLTELPGDPNFMLLTCVEGHKAGTALALVEVDKERNRLTVTGRALKSSLGLENTYLRIE